MRQRWMMLTLLFCATLIATTAAQKPGSFGDAAKMADTVKGLDAKRFEAQTKNDIAALTSMLGDDLVYVHSNAKVDGKSAFIESISSGKTKYETIEPVEVQVRVYGNTAIVNGLAKLSVTTDGKTTSFSLRYTDIWVMRDNKWQMVSWQSTRVPA